MTLTSLFAANLVLLARLLCLFKDEPASVRAWMGKTIFEAGMLFACFQVSAASVGALCAVVIANVIGAKMERRSRRRNFNRLLVGALELAVLSLLFAPAAGIEFRPLWSELAWRLPERTTFAPLLTGLVTPDFQFFLLGLLLSANEANLMIRAIFDWLDLKPRAEPEGKGVVDVGEFNRGRVIGLLERSLIYGFILQGQYGAIGFVLAAKAFTRFKALDDRSFAEYVLIGTLLSGGLALLFGLLVAQGAKLW